MARHLGRQSRLACGESPCAYLMTRRIGRATALLRQAGLTFRNDIVKGFGGSQVLLDDPSGNPVELWQRA